MQGILALKETYSGQDTGLKKGNIFDNLSFYLFRAIV